MLRKVLIFSTILLIVFLAYFSYKLLKEKEVAVNALIDAVPFDASLIIEINRPEILFSIVYKPPINAESFFNIPFINEPFEKLKTIDSIASQNTMVRNALRRPHSALISGHQIGKGDLEMIYYLKLNSEKEYESFDKLIKQNLKARGNITQHHYEDARINDVTAFNRKSGSFSYAYYRGMLVLSKSSILLEEVIRQTKSPASIRTKAGLETVMNTAGKSSPFNIYLNFDFFPTLALNFIHLRFKPELDAISRFAHWIELDCNVDDNALIMNGFSSAENTNGFLSDIFKDQEPLNLLLPGLLPAGTKSFFALGITDYSKFKVNFSDYQRKNLSNPDFEKNFSNFKEATGADLENEFLKVFDQEVCFSFYPTGTDILTDHIFTVIKTKGFNEAKQFVSQITLQPEKNQQDTSGVFPTLSNIPKILFGNIFGLNQNKYCTIVDNYIIFSDSALHLSTFTNEFSQLKNLSLNQNYRNLTDLLSEDMYCYFYLSPLAEQLYRHYLKYTSEQMLSQYKYGLSQVQAIAYQFGRNNDLFYNNAFIRFSPKTQGNVSKQWETNLENALSSDITLVKNHLNGETEIICQDKSNNLYLISPNGEIAWKRKLESRILGNIYQADLFRNKKLQFVYNTSNHINAIDRNGKDVEGYPVKLVNKASGGMALFDYDKSRNYRLLVPSVDKRLHCFDKEGKEVPGWQKPQIGLNPRKIESISTNGKDYIVVADEEQIHFFDRKGQERIKTSQNIKVAKNSGVFGYSKKNSFHFESTDSTGTIYIIALNGNVTKIQTGIYPPHHYYFPGDVNFDKKKDHIFFYDRKFEAFTSSGARITNHALNGKVHGTPKIITKSDSTFLYTYTDTIANKIFIHNNLGDQLAATPLTGNSEIAFKIFDNSNSILNLYYCNNNILFCVSVK